MCADAAKSVVTVGPVPSPDSGSPTPSGICAQPSASVGVSGGYGTDGGNVAGSPGTTSPVSAAGSECHRHPNLPTTSLASSCSLPSCFDGVYLAGSRTVN